MIGDCCDEEEACCGGALTNIELTSQHAIHESFVDAFLDGEMTERIGEERGRRQGVVCSDLEPFSGSTASQDIPLESIPLPELKREIDVLMAAAMEGKFFDEQRLEYLEQLLRENVEHIAEQLEERRNWRATIASYCSECLAKIRSMVSPTVANASLKDLISLSLSKALASRFLQKQPLHLVRMPSNYIASLHYAELSTRFNPIGQNLDVTEFAAVYATLPEFFPKDADGRKANLLMLIESKLRSMLEAREAGDLREQQLSCSLYTEHVPLFADDPRLLTAADDGKIMPLKHILLSQLETNRQTAKCWPRLERSLPMRGSWGPWSCAFGGTSSSGLSRNRGSEKQPSLAWAILAMGLSMKEMGYQKEQQEEEQEKLLMDMS